MKTLSERWTVKNEWKMTNIKPIHSTNQIKSNCLFSQGMITGKALGVSCYREGPYFS